MTDDIWSLEAKLQALGSLKVAGVDEAGRGPLAGPVVAAAVILPPASHCRSFLPRLRESKQLSSNRREKLAGLIQALAVSIGIGRVGVDYIDSFNILEATRLAMKKAIQNLVPEPDHVLVDAVRLNDLSYPLEAIVRGDLKCACIAAASIMAKVDRDRIMIKWDQTYPGYGFKRNKGYGTAEHLAALAKLGPSPIHRLSFKPVRSAAQRRMKNNGEKNAGKTG